MGSMLRCHGAVATSGVKAAVVAIAAQADLVVEQLLVLLQAENLSAPGPGAMRGDLRSFYPLLARVNSARFLGQMSWLVDHAAVAA
jgi:hypothetical protein